MSNAMTQAFDQLMAVDRLKEAAFVMSILNSNDYVTKSSTVDMDRLYAASNEFHEAKRACEGMGIDLPKIVQSIVDKRKVDHGSNQS